MKKTTQAAIILRIMRPGLAISMLSTFVVCAAMALLYAEPAQSDRPLPRSWTQAAAKKAIRQQLCGAPRGWRCLGVNTPTLLSRNTHSEQWSEWSSFKEGKDCVNLGLFGIQCRRTRWVGSAGVVSDHTGIVYHLRRR